MCFCAHSPILRIPIFLYSSILSKLLSSLQLQTAIRFLLTSYYGLSIISVYINKYLHAHLHTYSIYTSTYISKFRFILFSSHFDFLGNSSVTVFFYVVINLLITLKLPVLAAAPDILFSRTLRNVHYFICFFHPPDPYPILHILYSR